MFGGDDPRAADRTRPPRRAAPRGARAYERDLTMLLERRCNWATTRSCRFCSMSAETALSRTGRRLADRRPTDGLPLCARLRQRARRRRRRRFPGTGGRRRSTPPGRPSRPGSAARAAPAGADAERGDRGDRARAAGLRSRGSGACSRGLSAGRATGADRARAHRSGLALAGGGDAPQDAPHLLDRARSDGALPRFHLQPVVRAGLCLDRGGRSRSSSRRSRSGSPRGAGSRVGGMWLESDCNVTGGEAFVRQLFYGQRYFREPVRRSGTTVAWLPDVFGFSGRHPAAPARRRDRRLLHDQAQLERREPFPYDLFEWEGIDGSRVNCATCSSIPAHGYNGNIVPLDTLGTWRNFRGKTQHPESLLAFGWGDGAGGPTEKMLENYARIKEFPALPRLRHGQHRASFSPACRSGGLPSWVGELYLELHRGTLTTPGANQGAQPRRRAPARSKPKPSRRSPRSPATPTRATRSKRPGRRCCSTSSTTSCPARRSMRSTRTRCRSSRAWSTAAAGSATRRWPTSRASRGTIRRPGTCWSPMRALTAASAARTAPGRTRVVSGDRGRTARRCRRSRRRRDCWSPIRRGYPRARLDRRMTSAVPKPARRAQEPMCGPRRATAARRHRERSAAGRDRRGRHGCATFRQDSTAASPRRPGQPALGLRRQTTVLGRLGRRRDLRAGRRGDRRRREDRGRRGGTGRWPRCGSSAAGGSRGSCRRTGSEPVHAGSTSPPKSTGMSGRFCSRRASRSRSASHEATYETMYGVVRRATHRNTSLGGGPVRRVGAPLRWTLRTGLRRGDAQRRQVRATAHTRTC